MDIDIKSVGILDVKHRVKRPQCGPASVDIICFRRHGHLPEPREASAGVIETHKFFSDLDLNEDMTGLGVVNLGWVVQCSHACFPVVVEVDKTGIGSGFIRPC